MNTNFLIALGLTFISFIVPAVCYNFIAGKSNFNRKINVFQNTFFPPVAIWAVLSLGAYLFLYQEDDFINSFNILQLLLPLVGAFAINYTDCTAHPSRFFLIALLAVSTCVAVMPQSSLNLFPQLSSFSNGLILATIGFCYVLLFQYANCGEGLLSLHALTVSIGIGFLGMVNAVPFMLSLFSWILSGSFAALLAFSWAPSRIKISNRNAMAFGFLLFSLIAPVIGEGAASCCLIFSAFLIFDFLWALALKLSFAPIYNNLYLNSSFQHVVAKGVSPNQAGSFVLKIQSLMLFLGIFQAYSPNPWSLGIITLLMISWLTFRFRSMTAPIQNIKDINAHVLEELQDRVNEFKDFMQKDNDR